MQERRSIHQAAPVLRRVAPIDKSSVVNKQQISRTLRNRLRRESSSHEQSAEAYSLLAVLGDRSPRDPVRDGEAFKVSFLFCFAWPYAF